MTRKRKNNQFRARPPAHLREWGSDLIPDQEDNDVRTHMEDILRKIGRISNVNPQGLCATSYQLLRKISQMDDNPDPKHRLRNKRIALYVCCALTNQVHLQWDAEEVSSMRKKNRLMRGISAGSYVPADADPNLLKLNGNKGIGQLDKPSTILDREGRILVWYFPKILETDLQKDIIEATKVLVRNLPAGEKAYSWRNEGGIEGTELPSGAKSFSPGWFALGHDRKQDPLCATPLLNESKAQTWTAQIKLVEEQVNNITSLIAPRLFKAGMDAQEGLKSYPNPKVHAPAQDWPSCFTGMSVISNRITPAHVDPGNRTWYDVLVAAGNYTDCMFTLPDIEGYLPYPPGTVVALNGFFIRHEVARWTGADRVCLAHFMRPKVLQRLLHDSEVDTETWVKITDFDYND